MGVYSIFLYALKLFLIKVFLRFIHLLALCMHANTSNYSFIHKLVIDIKVNIQEPSHITQVLPWFTPS
jgi:hypothetical protein